MKIGQLIVPVTEIETALAFYGDELGLELKFRDGDRYAAVHDGNSTVALAGPGQQPAETIAIGMKVADVDAIASRLRAAGVTVGDVQRGAHELRVSVSDPFGNPLVLYGPLPA